MALPETINLNGNSYRSADLTEAARNQVVNIQAVDAEIARLQVQMGIAQTARNAYVAVLVGALPASATPATVQAAAKPAEADAAAA